MQNVMLIHCHSQAQALDWSLVLISQGIENIVTQNGSEGGWSIEVAESDWGRASESLAAYESENRTPWRREVKWAGLLFDVRGAFFFLGLIAFHFLAEAMQKDFKVAGAVDRTAVLRGEWWRVFTAETLHVDVAHLLGNATSGFVFLGLAMGGYRAGVALFLSLLGGALGNVFSLLLHEAPFRSVGASGFVMASLGLLAAHSISFSRHERRAVWIGRGAIAGCLLAVMLGLSPDSDVLAHIGGFIAGMLLGAGAAHWRPATVNPRLNQGAFVAFVFTVALTWLLALR